MVDDNNKEFFWPSYVDLMTALFAVILVLFVFTYFNFKKKEKDLIAVLAENQKQAKILEKIKANLKLFEEDSTKIFRADYKHNRILLGFEIQFNKGYDYYKILPDHLKSDYINTTDSLKLLGKTLKKIIDKLRSQKASDSTMKDISYLLVISGSASDFPKDDKNENYLLSYRRALSLYYFWRDNLNIDFDSPTYHDIIELQISGTGIGGVGRFKADNDKYAQDNSYEEKNQRFIIHITPKIGL
jgi:hypothetical protein